MRHKFLCLMLACGMAVCCFGVNTGAISVEVQNAEGYVVKRATERFSMNILSGTLAEADTSFPLEKGETVSIDAVYSPKDASVDFGLIGPDGLFYSVNTSNGSFDKTLKVGERGQYTLAIRNNSSYAISVSGHVTY